MKYAFIDEHVEQHPVRRLCSVMQVHPSGYYAWKQAPLCDRAREDVRVSALISWSWKGSGRVYGYRKVGNDLRDMGERCGKHRVARLMRLAGQRSHTGYKRRPGKYGGRPAVVVPRPGQARIGLVSLVLLLPLISARLPSQALDTSCLNRGQDMRNGISFFDCSFSRDARFGGRARTASRKARSMLKQPQARVTATTSSWILATSYPDIH